MFASLSARVAAIGATVMIALASLAGVLASASHQTSESFKWVTHSAAVIETTQLSLAFLRAAESGQRGFIITRDPGYPKSFEQQLSISLRNIAHVVELTTDNPVQHARARELETLMTDRASFLRKPLDLGRQGAFAAAVQEIASGPGSGLMDEISTKARAFLDEERRLQDNRSAAAERRLRLGKELVLSGASAVALLVLVGFALLIRSIRRPLDTLLDAMTTLGMGAQEVRMADEMGSKEFTRLAQGYNAMADRLQLAVADRVESERQLQVANAELQRNGDILRERGDAIELLGGMAHRMQAARTDEELAAIIRVFVPRVLPGLPGVLFAHNNSRNLLSPLASWGDIADPPDGFAPDQCWALRRGQSHSITEPGEDIVCGHASADEIYHCEPLLAAGEVIGVLYLHGRVGAESRFPLTVLTENIASALVNHRLQRSLREQTIRDPLTGLFNRRYMEEALKLEIARAARSGAPLSLIMCDVDHFKRFNDEFGHDAGDAVLQAVAAEMRSHFRDGDVVCRFGGEEFTIIAPGTSAEALANRVELVRQAIGELNVRHNGRRLGATSMSFGVASAAPDMAKDGSTLVQAADAALYQAKRDGRNRIVIGSLAA